jgi:hypothetical protein
MVTPELPVAPPTGEHSPRRRPVPSPCRWGRQPHKVTDVIPMPPHRTKGPGVLGATPEQPDGSLGRWPQDDDEDTTLVPDTALPAPRNGSDR